MGHFGLNASNKLKKKKLLEKVSLEHLGGATIFQRSNIQIIAGKVLAKDTGYYKWKI